MSAKSTSLRKQKQQTTHKEYDIIMILAGGIRQDGQLPSFSKQRVLKGIELFHAKYAQRILMSGRWSGKRQSIPPVTEAAAMVEYARKHTIPKSALYAEELSTSTHENVLFSKKYFFEKYHWNKILVVTSDLHMKRTKLVFNRILGKEYEVHYAAAKTSMNVIRLVWQWFKEQCLYYASIIYH